MKILTTFITLGFAAVNSLLAQIPNSDFNNWTSGVPDGWFTTTSSFGTVTQSSPGYNGSPYAVSLYLTNSGGNAEITTGTDISNNQFIISGNPTSLTGWVKSSNPGSLNVTVNIWKQGGILIGTGNYNAVPAYSSWTQFTAPINYSAGGQGKLAEIDINLTPNVGPGEGVLVDSLNFNYPTGVINIENNVSLESPYPNPASDICTVIYSIQNSSAVKIAIYDLSGRKVMNLMDNTKQTPGRYIIPANVSALTNGVYVFTITADEIQYTQKMVIIKNK